MAVAGFRLRNAFNHFVFMDELDVDNFRSLRGGDPKSAFPKNNSFCKNTNKYPHLNYTLLPFVPFIFAPQNICF